MSELTKEQLDEIDSRVKDSVAYDITWMDGMMVEEMRELLRGYRAYLEAVKHHEDNKDTDTYVYNLTGNKDFKDSGAYHRARLFTLKSEVSK